MKPKSLVFFVFLLCSCFISATARRINLDGDVFARQNAARRAENRRLYRETMFSFKKNERQKAIQPSDLTALKDFYQSTFGEFWVNNTNWMSGDPCTAPWLGVYCDQDGYVLSITLVYNNVSGQISEKLTLAKRLQTIILYDNALTKPIPEAILAMESLQTLEASFNQIPGKLPSTLSMPNIQTLSLGSNYMDGPLPTSWDTPKLEELDLNTNSFTGELPTGLSSVRSLKTLYLSINNLRGDYPASWGSLTSLQLLWLFSNKGLTGPFPSSWENMVGMQNIATEQMTGSFPSYFGNWRGLTSVQIVRGSLVGSLPSNFCNLMKLQTLWLFQNNISGEIPNCVGQNPLVDFELSNNFFTGPIPSSLGECKSIIYILLDDNKLTGTIPESLGRLDKLQTIRLSNNAITGPIPDSFGSLRSLVNLELSGCRLTGSIPSSFGSLLKLEVLNLCQNQLTGCLPSTLNDLDDLAELSICYNLLNCVDNGLETLFGRLANYGCFMYDNPWTCPLPSFVPSNCQASCSKCNTATNHNDCSTCVQDSSCGYCRSSEASNCLEGSPSGPSGYYCSANDWTYGKGAC